MMKYEDAQKIVEMLYEHMNDLYEKMLEAAENGTNEQQIETMFKYREAQDAFYEACKLRDKIAA